MTLIPCLPHDLDRDWFEDVVGAVIVGNDETPERREKMNDQIFSSNYHNVTLGNSLDSYILFNHKMLTSLYTCTRTKSRTTKASNQNSVCKIGYAPGSLFTWITLGVHWQYFVFISSMMFNIKQATISKCYSIAVSSLVEPVKLLLL